MFYYIFYLYPERHLINESRDPKLYFACLINGCKVTLSFLYDH